MTPLWICSLTHEWSEVSCVIWPSTEYVARLDREGLLMKFDRNLLKNIDGVSDFYSEGWWDNATGYPTGAGDTVCLVRSNATSLMVFNSVSGACPSPAPYRERTPNINDNCTFNSPNSFHGGGALAVFGDGAVRKVDYSANSFLSGSATETIIEALVTARGNEPIPDTFAN